MPIQGYSAKIKYYFDINTTARPKLNEDGALIFINWEILSRSKKEINLRHLRRPIVEKRVYPY